MKEMIGYCGLDCEKCDAYLATIHGDQALRGKAAALWAKLNDTRLARTHHLRRVASGIKTVFCQNLCNIRQCALKKGASTCGDCPDFKNCPSIGAIIANHPSVLENLKR